MFPLPHPLPPFLFTQLRGERFEGAPSLSFSPFLRFAISAGGDKIAARCTPQLQIEAVLSDRQILIRRFGTSGRCTEAPYKVIYAINGSLTPDLAVLRAFRSGITRM